MPAQPVPTRREQRQAQSSARTQRHRRELAAARQRRLVTLAAGAIVLAVIALVVVRFINSNSAAAAAPDRPAPPELVGQVAGVPAAIYDQVGRGTANGLPTPVRGSVERGANRLPLVTYIGAEYCPFCAAERWSLVAALGRFGSFNGLQLSHSASDDVYPNTPTFSFVGSSYSSPYVEFSPVELQTNVRSGNTYQALQTPTPAQTSVLQKYDVPPYVPAQSAGAIPFTDLAGQYLLSGAGYDAGVLRGMSAEQIAAALADPSSAVARAILGHANALTAAICSATGDNPPEVCATPTVQSLEASLAATAVPARSP
jgi:hypothetical protein